MTRIVAVLRKCYFYQGAMLFATLAAASGQAQSDRPNILFIFSDDHAVQAIGAYGSQINRDAQH